MHLSVKGWRSTRSERISTGLAVRPLQSSDGNSTAKAASPTVNANEHLSLDAGQFPGAEFSIVL
jgi:hypothetical protein